MEPYQVFYLLSICIYWRPKEIIDIHESMEGLSTYKEMMGESQLMIMEFGKKMEKGKNAKDKEKHKDNKKSTLFH